MTRAFEGLRFAPKRVMNRHVSVRQRCLPSYGLERLGGYACYQSCSFVGGARRDSCSKYAFLLLQVLGSSSLHSSILQSNSHSSTSRLELYLWTNLLSQVVMTRHTHTSK